jgi:hypothetical protein
MSEANRRRRESIKLDQMMRVLFGLSKKVMVPLLGGLFGERFASDQVTIQYGNGKFVDHKLGQIEGDLFITVRTADGKQFSYHIEFQTHNDGQMVIRMFRYSFEKAVELAQAEGRIDTEDRTIANGKSLPVIEFPRQLVIFIEENQNINDHLAFLLRMPDGQEMEYRVPVLKYWTYSAEQLKNHNLYALLPLQVFNSRKRMNAIYESGRSDSEKSLLMTEQFQQLKMTIQTTLDVLKDVQQEQKIGTGDMDRILRVLHSITDYLYTRYGQYEAVREEVHAMIKTWIDPKVREEGIKEGIKEGKHQKSVEIARNLFSLGASTDLIVKATGLTEEDIAKLNK